MASQIPENAEFYKEYYSDWTVHALPLMVYVPLAPGNDDREFAIDLVKEILDEATFDIRILDLGGTNVQS